ncbi:hypothetical protein KQX54_009109 [Cotesia glomerata]|uniref:Uncharacterized protein n=1 Tax=Cotesia glomerata TaxID=32391 RepID=A0AAV7IYE3_COTGL|nr:hypothetical protein KQX54_009109 [Cotesia glomerata]
MQTRQDCLGLVDTHGTELENQALQLGLSRWKFVVVNQINSAEILCDGRQNEPIGNRMEPPGKLYNVSGVQFKSSGASKKE